MKAILTTRVENTLTQGLKCTREQITPEFIAQNCKELWRLSGMPHFGKAAMREVKAWMADAGYAFSHTDGWVKEERKPELKTRIVKVQYWDCGVPEHSHKTCEVAAECMQKRAERKTQPSKAEKRARWLVAMRLVLDGQTYNDVGNHLGISANRVRQIVHKVRRMALWNCPDIPEHDYWNIRDIRKHKDFYLKRMEHLAARWSAEREEV